MSQGKSSPSGLLSLHTSLVNTMKRAAREVLEKRGSKMSRDTLPLTMGLRPLTVDCPPNLEGSSGYRGNMRYVALYYSPITAVPVHSDGGDELPMPNPDDWTTFVNHPAMCGALHNYTSLSGRIGVNRMLTPEEVNQLPADQRRHYCSRFHALVLDRDKRRLYVANWQQLKMFQACAEPDGEEVHIQLADGTLVSPGNESWNDPVNPMLVEAVWRSLDEQLKSPHVQLEMASWRITEGQTDEARLLLENISHQVPDFVSSTSFQFVLASLHQQTHEYTAALIALENSIRQRDCNDFTLNQRLADLCLNAGRFDKALPRLEKMRSELIAQGAWENPTDVAEWYQMSARAHVGLGDLNTATQLCLEGIAEVVRINEDDGVCACEPGEATDADAAELYLQLAEVAALQNDCKTAADNCRHALKSDLYDPDEINTQPIAVYRVGWWYPRRKRVSRAANLFDEAITDRAKNLLGLGYLYLGMNRYADAAETIEKTIEHFDITAEVLWLSGIALLATKQQAEAGAAFAQISDQYSGDERGHVGLALVCAADGANDNALEECEKALSINPNSGEAHALMAYLLWSSACYVAAKFSFEESKRLGYRLHHMLAAPPEEDGKTLRFMMLGRPSEGYTILP